MWQENWRLALKVSRFLIDALDFLMIKLLGWRMWLCKRIGRIKTRHSLPIYMPEREKEILKKRQMQAKKFNISDKAVRILVKAVMWESKRIQSELVNA